MNAENRRTSREPVEIREAMPDDGPAIAWLSGQLGYPSSPSRLDDRLRAICASPADAVFVACIGQRVVGWIHAFLALRVESDPFAELGGLVVATSHRRQGIGGRLLAAAEAWASARGAGKLRVRLRPARTGARRFYHSLGFTAVKEQEVLDKPLPDPARGIAVQRRSAIDL